MLITVGAERFKEIFEKYSDRPLLLYGDPDVDGLISLLFMCQLCDMLDRKYSYYVNPGRHHGFAIPFEKVHGYLVMCADFAIKEEELKKIVSSGVVLLSTDHHEVQNSFISVEDRGLPGIVLSNQYPFEPEENRYLSGAGVFYELACYLYPGFRSAERDALVGVTLLSDARNIENPLARKYLKATYSTDPDSGYPGYLVKACGGGRGYSFGRPKFDRNFIDYTLSPTINALLRADKLQDAVGFILGSGFSGFDARALQKAVLEAMFKVVRVSTFPYIVFLHVPAEPLDWLDVSLTNYIGLFCSNYSDRNGGVSVLGFITREGRIIRASFRGRYDELPYRTRFKDLGLLAEGHPSAFGILDFRPEKDTWSELSMCVEELEAEHEPTFRVIDTQNLGAVINQVGSRIAIENMYVRDMYRTYIRYRGSNAKIIKQTYKMEELSDSDIKAGVPFDEERGGVRYRYLRDDTGSPIIKYMEYMIDGQKVKSFGDTVEDGFILPIMENGYTQLYLRGSLL